VRVHPCFCGNSGLAHPLQSFPAQAGKADVFLAAGFPAAKPVKEPLMETNISSHATSGNGSAAAQAARGTYNEIKGAAQRTAASLRSELSSLKNDLDSLVNRAPSLSDDELTQAHAQLMAKFSSVRYAAKGIASQASRQLNRGVETTTEYVKDKPMQSVAVAVGTGLLLGLLFKRR
jgi:ElaB/YqjD/DUF883 family membrane-anchored ribosome-binding protein